MDLANLDLDFLAMSEWDEGGDEEIEDEDGESGGDETDIDTDDGDGGDDDV